MTKTKWQEYWQKRAVKAENALTAIGAVSEGRKYDDIAQMVREYYASVAAGEVKETAVDGDNS